MSKRKGLSLEEKRTKMLELFYEKKSFFQLKEIEKLAPKEKGITPMSVKEVVQSLVDDGLVDTDKIGTSVYFWAFPSKAVQTRKNKINQLQNSINQLENDNQQLETQIEQSNIGKENTDERVQLVAKYEQLSEQLDSLKSRLNLYEDCSSEYIENLKETISLITEGINRWTDNIFGVIAFCKNKLSIEEKEVYKYFGIADDFDYCS